MTPDAKLIAVLTSIAAMTWLIAWPLTRLAMHIARSIGFVDCPAGHKSHREPMPYGGGTAILLSAWGMLGIGLVAVLLIPSDWIAREYGQLFADYAGGAKIRLGQGAVILTGGLLLHVMGLIDDRKPLGPYLKLLVEIAVSGLVAVWGDVRLAEFLPAPAAIGVTIAWFVVIINAFNFLDNMDGLSAGVAVICLSFLAICGVMAGQVLVPVLACVCLGAVGGFLVWNFPPARIFMGDAGSLFIGYVIAVISTLTTYFESGRAAPPFALAMPLIVLAIPLYDFISVVVIRHAEGRNPMQGDQRHFSHRLVERGLSRRFAVLTIYLATATTGMAATLLPGADLRQTLSIVIMVLMVLAIVAILEAPLRRDP